MRNALTFSLVSILLASCAPPQDANSPKNAPEKEQPMTEPDHITVDHILIGVKGSLPVERTVEQAKAIADEVVASLNAGEDWDVLKTEFSDDPPQKGGPRGGPYAMANDGVAASPPSEYARRGMVAAFGNVGFKLKVGEIGVAPYDAKTSPFGFHIIKRVQ